MRDPGNIFDICKSQEPKEAPNVIEFSEENLRDPSSVLTERFKMDNTPWLLEPLSKTVHDPRVRGTTLVKPVQTGGSKFGEALICYWIRWSRGFLQYNWSTDKKANDRWASRFESILKNCKAVFEMMGELARFEGKKCEIDFGKVFFRMQGSFNPDNLDSDSVRLQVNEEVHAWEPGHVEKARNRQSAVWDRKFADISNAGKKGGELHKQFKLGTQQYWTVKCPGCGLFHAMRAQWEDTAPQMGGLRYNADGARRGRHEYDYNKIASTVFYQMPCGWTLRNDKLARRRLSLTGKYTEPIAGSDSRHLSFTYEAVAVDFIDWIELIKAKHEALRALNAGDPEPWRIYRTEKECLFYDVEEAPAITSSLILTTGNKKSRTGLPYPVGNPFDGGKLRLSSLDRQIGDARSGEFPYWWLLIRDFAMTADGLESLLVFEGKLETDEQAIATLKEYNCNMWQVTADSGDDTTHVYLFCLQHGINAIKGGKESFYAHGDTKRIFGVERPLHMMLSRPPMFPYIPSGDGVMPDPREPMFWLYSKHGIRERFFWLRGSTKHMTPEDVSEDYKAHQSAETRVVRQHPRTGEDIVEWHQLKRRNDQFVNECYIAMQAEMAGLIAPQIPMKPQATK